LILVFLIVGLLPMLVVSMMNYRNAAGVLRKNAGTSLADLAFNASDKLDRNLFERYGDVQAYAKSDAAKSMDTQKLTSWMNTMMVTYTPIYKLMVVADLKGRIIAVNTLDLDGKPLQSQSLLDMDVSSSSWFKAAAGGSLADGVSHVEDMHEDPLVSRVYGSGAASYAMNFTYPIRADDGRIIGVWTNRFNWKVAEDILAAVVGHARKNGATTTAVTLVSRDGTVLASNNAEDVLSKQLADVPAVRRAMMKNAAGFEEGSSLSETAEEEMSGVFQSAGYSVYPGVDWYRLSRRRSGFSATRRRARQKISICSRLSSATSRRSAAGCASTPGNS